MRGTLLEQNVESSSTDTFILQNERLLKVALDGEVMARQGSMVAYQGEMTFDYEGSGSIGKFLKKALTGEGVPLMKARGRGDLFLAHDADEVHLVYLENEGLSVSGHNILAFDPGLTWDIKRVEGVSFVGGAGLFNTLLTGTGWVAITAHGSPVVLRTDQPTFVDAQSIVAWSAGLSVRAQRSMKLGALIGRGSGEAFQLVFSGRGLVVVQASEGATVPPHNHG